MNTDRLLTFSDSFTISSGTITLDLALRKILLVRYRPKNQIFFPKGRKNIGEAIESAAVRETFEESGYHCELLPHHGVTKAPLAGKGAEEEPLTAHTEPFAVQQWVYPDGVRKFIFWFLAKGDSTQQQVEGTQDEEEDFETMWLGWDEAVEKASFEDDQKLIRRALGGVKV